MKNIELKKCWPYLIGIVIFALVSVLYFAPEIFEGKTLFQGDTQQGIALGHEIKEYREQTGETTRWSNSVFSGMPTFQTSPRYGVTPVMNTVQKILHLWIPQPAGYLFLMMVGFFILLLTFKVNIWISIIGALIYTFSSYFLIIIEAGHIWKFITLAYIPPTIGGIILTYRGKYLAGGALTALFAALQIFSNHVQMTYYFLFVILALVIAIFINKYQEKQLPQFFKASAVLVFAGVLAVCVNISNLYHTYEYSKHTMRGGTELSQTSSGAEPQSGLDKAYITQWSYGKVETLSLMIPNIKGGGTGALSSNQKAMKDVNPQLRPYMSQLNQYWGDQPFTSGPVYIGAFVVFLFILSLFIVTGPIKWALVSAVVFSIFLSWGKNFMVLTDIFIDYVPMYNKFRAVSSMLVIAEFCIPILAMLGLNKIVKDPSIIKTKIKAFYVSLGITGGLCALFAFFPTLFFDFLSEQESVSLLAQAKQQPELMSLIHAMIDARISIFSADAWRSLIIIVIGAAMIYLYSKNIIKQGIMLLVIGALCLGDLWMVDKRYLNASDFVSKKKLDQPFQMSPADKLILQDQDQHYRVLNLTSDTFNDYKTSYFHKSIGGYHAAKLQRYQDIINYYLSGQINPDVVNMLNGKYIIVPGENNTQNVSLNPDALGNAWFVENIDWANNADQEITLLGEINPKTTAVINKKFEKEVKPFSYDSLATITLTKYEPNRLTYTAKTQGEQLAVFSEIYYPGWKALVNGKETEIFQTDYTGAKML